MDGSHRDAGAPLTRRELRRLREQQGVDDGEADSPTAGPASAPASASPEPAAREPEASPQIAPPMPTRPEPTASPAVSARTTNASPSSRFDSAVAAMFTSSAEGQPDAEASVSSVPTILTVCTGNICRSPLAETLLHTRLAPRGVRVHSAGTHGLAGHPMTEPAQQIALTRGGDAGYAAAHTARVLREDLLDDADLVLTMTAEHSSFAMQLMPRRMRRIFRVREFARLARTL
ncbi:MAG: hypothetical protein WA971_06670, partial [Microbacterium sp.]